MICYIVLLGVVRFDAGLCQLSHDPTLAIYVSSKVNMKRTTLYQQEFDDEKKSECIYSIADDLFR